MKDIIFLITVTLIGAWALGFFALSLGSFIHIFLLIATILIIVQVIQGRVLYSKNNP